VRQVIDFLESSPDPRGSFREGDKLLVDDPDSYHARRLAEQADEAAMEDYYFGVKHDPPDDLDLAD